MLEEQGEITSALDLLNAGIEASPNEGELRIRRGSILMNCLRRYDDALADFAAVAEISPNNAALHQHFALCYLLMGDSVRASASAMMAIAISDDALSHFLYGRCLVAEGRNHAANKEFQLATQKEPESGLFWEGLGDTFHRVGAVQDAIEAYNTALSLKETVTVLNKLAWLKLEKNDYVGALLLLDRVKLHKTTEVESVIADGIRKNIMERNETQS